MSWEQQNQHFGSIGVVPAFWEKVIAPRVKQLKGNKCQECGSQDRLCLHHSDYELQNIETLKLLCFNCHNELHRSIKRR